MRSNYISSVVCAIALQACAVHSDLPYDESRESANTQSLSNTAPQATAEARTVSRISKLQEGDTVVFPSGAFAQFGKVTIGRQYSAASGKLCKQVYDFVSGKMLGIICKADEDNWYTRLSS